MFKAAFDKTRIPLHVLTAAGSLLLLASVALVLAWHAYDGTRKVLSSTVDEDALRVSQVLRDKIRGILEPAVGQIEILAYHDLVKAGTASQRLAGVPLAQSVFASNPLLDAWYIGYPDGAFVLFRKLRDPALQKTFGAPPGTTLLVQMPAWRDRAGEYPGEYLFYDEASRLLLRQTRPDYRFDPRERPWYRAAQGKRDAILTSPYVFFTTRSAGTTLAREAFPGGPVIGMDATLDTLAQETRELKITPGSIVAIADAEGDVIARSDGVTPVSVDVNGVARLARLDHLDLPQIVAAGALPARDMQRAEGLIGEDKWALLSIPVQIRADGKPLRVLMGIPHAELFSQARSLLQHQLLITLALILAAVPAGYWLTQRIVKPLRSLVDTTRAVAAFDFSDQPLKHSRIAEVDLLASATAQMKATIARFLDVNVALNSEARLERLLEIVLKDVVEMSRARSASIYLYDEGTLRRSQLILSGSAQAAHPETLPGEGLHPATMALHGHRSVVGRGEQGGPELVAVPLETLSGESVGVMLIELDRPLRQDGTRDPLLGFIEALSSTAAVAIETRHLIDAQKNLLEGMIQLTAGAIDAKSPYTGGHCQRVPAITKMLLHAAEDAREGHFKDFKLSEEEWEAVHVGAWLHDCGKVTTPEYVVDKATKLEGIFNRIHEVRMRFEVLKRDAEIACWKARSAGVAEDTARAVMEQAWRTLDEEFAFVASCNVGSEFLDSSKIARLHEIGEREWTRTLDDRLGLSRDEMRQLENVAPHPLPAAERLLADKPEHLVERTEQERFKTENPWGFRIKVPQYKFNRGELYNLAIGRGTLTEEERYIINDHIVQTIVMLERLPFPRHLKGVPEIAGGHHERMDGRGYPRGLTREQMSVPARTMAIADVFEALTAADRPYKPPKTLSESLTIMARMTRDRHLDADLFVLFVRSGVYRRYSEEFLTEAQRDEVNEDAIVAQALEAAFAT